MGGGVKEQERSGMECWRNQEGGGKESSEWLLVELKDKKRRETGKSKNAGEWKELKIWTLPLE